MEAVLKAAVPFFGIFDIPWKRIVRGCLILSLSGILYLCMQSYVQSCRTEVKGRILLLRTADMSKGIEIADSCQSVKKAVRNAAEEGMPPFENLNENVTVSLVQKDEDNIVITERADRKENIKESVSAPGIIDGSDDAQVRNPGISSRLDSPLMSETEDISRTDLPDVSNPVVNEEPVNSGNAELMEIAGFIVDAEGYIVGCMTDFVLVDGIVVLPVDENCIGIRRDALSDAGQDVMEIYIPENITNIEQGVFDTFPYLMYIEVSAKNPSYYSADGVLYTISGEIAACPAGR